MKQFVIPVKLELSDQNASLKNDGRIREIKNASEFAGIMSWYWR
ncbi:MAG: hypothetical protein WCK87_01685 [Candidatus Saccharibacteria bacterium]